MLCSKLFEGGITMKRQLNQLVVIAIVLSFLIAGCSSGATPLPSSTQVPLTQPPTTQPLPTSATPAVASKSVRDSHERLNSVLWMQTAAEYRIVCQTIFDSAKGALDYALKDLTWTAALEQTGPFQALPPAIVVDLDETIFDNSPFWGRLVVDRIGYDFKLWSEWMARADATAVPGAIEFLKNAESKGVTVFYVTNRNANMEVATRTNLTKLGLALPAAIDTVLMNGEKPGWNSVKSSRRAFIATTHRILLLVGDDLGDFVSDANDTPEKRVALAAKYPIYWGSRWILLPNPVAGSWESALYGNLFDAPDEIALGKKFEQVNYLGKPTAIPTVAAATATVTFAGDKCTMDGPQKMLAGTLAIDWIIVDKHHDLLGLCAVTLDAGKTIEDLKAWGSAVQPPWVRLIDCWNGAPDSRKTVNVELKRGSNYLVCFTSPTTCIGPLGPIEVE
jgi:5'-nucleotidase (lipoprotein e(P4) family)